MVERGGGAMGLLDVVGEGRVSLCFLEGREASEDLFAALLFLPLPLLLPLDLGEGSGGGDGESLSDSEGVLWRDLTMLRSLMYFVATVCYELY